MNMTHQETETLFKNVKDMPMDMVFAFVFGQMQGHIRTGSNSEKQHAEFFMQKVKEYVNR